MAVSRIHGEELSEYVRWFREHADEVEVPDLRKRVWQLSSELGSLDRKLAGMPHEREQWMQKLDDLQGALVACDMAKGVGSLCHPFYARFDRVISECEHETAQSASAPAE